ncbi:hypothetical protein Tco_1539900 [Tanacetum coccineum]
MKVEESLNVTFDETPPPPKTSPLEDDELVEEEAIEKIRIEQYFLMIDYDLWEVIVKGDSPPPKRTVDGVEQTYPPTTADEKLARKNDINMMNVVIKLSMQNPSNSPQKIKERDLQQIDADDLEKMDLKWQMAMLTMRARRFLNKIGRKINANGSETIGAPRENKNREPIRRNVTMETTKTKALVAQVGLGSLSSDSEVSACSKACLKSYETLKEHYDNLTKDFNKSQLNVGAYKAGLKSIKARLDMYKKNGDSSSDKSRTGVGYDSQVVDSQVFDSQKNDKHKTSEGYHAVPPPYTGNFMPPKPNLVLVDEEEYVFSKSKPKSVSEPLIEDGYLIVED